jgi:hypothetical protein
MRDGCNYTEYELVIMVALSAPRGQRSATVAKHIYLFHCNARVYFLVITIRKLEKKYTKQENKKRDTESNWQHKQQYRERIAGSSGLACANPQQHLSNTNT